MSRRERILAALTPNETISVAELARKVNMEEAEAERIVLDLVHENQVTYDLDGEYRLVRRSPETERDYDVQ